MFNITKTTKINFELLNLSRATLKKKLIPITTPQKWIIPLNNSTFLNSFKEAISNLAK